MRAFIDTSSLLKKYIEEDGAEEYNSVLESAIEIILSPVTILEIHSALQRRLKEGTLKDTDARWIEKELRNDYDFFAVIKWNDELINQCIRIIRTYQLRVLEAIQLSAGLLSNAGIFITSDKKLYRTAEKVLSNARFI